MLKVAITGVAGRMGRSLLAAAINHPQLELSGAIHREGSSLLGADAGELVGEERAGVPIVASIAETEFDVLIDFTLVEPSLHYLQYCLENGKAIVIGTTGFSETQKAQISQAAETIPVLFAPNMSVGVNLCFHLLRQAAQAIGEDADIEIIETHHRHKLDAPSGTALRMGEVIADTLNRDLNSCAVYGREGVSEPRDKNTIGFATIRAGDVIGDHTVLFATEGERVEITHKSSSRMTYANGAVRGAIWLHNQKPGLYDMQDLLGLV